MKYSDAINKLFNDYGVELFSTPYHAFCILNDYIGNDFEGKNLAIILYIVEKQIDIVSIFKDNSLQDARKIMENQYKEFRSLCSAKEYVAMINPISKYLRPNEFITALSSKKNNDSVAVIVKAHNKTNNTPLIINKESVKAVKPNKARKVKTNKTTLKVLMVDANCENFNFFTSDLVVGPEVYIDGELSKNKSTSILAGGVGVFYLNYPGQDIVIRVPKNQYESITFNGKCKNSSINYKSGNLLYSKRINIKLNCENLKIDGHADFINMDLNNTNLDLNGRYRKVDGVSNKGSFNFNLDLKGLNEFFMNWKQGQGNITGNFINVSSGIKDKARIHWFTSLNVDKYIDKTHCVLNLKTKSGKIKIK